MLFGKKKNPNEGKIFSPASGNVLPITEAPDKVFSEKMVGDGVAVVLENDTIVSPADGVLVSVADTYHAYGIQTADGIEILVHVGINTVELNGDGFECHVRQGQKIKKGELLCRVNLDVFKERGCPLHSPLLITNMDAVSRFSIVEGRAEAGESAVIEYVK